MPIHSAASVLQAIDPAVLVTTSSLVAGSIYLKTRAGGRKNTWERDWAGKMIIILGLPTPTILSLIDYLLNLPRPPQILYLPPYPSPLPASLTTLIQTLRLSTTNPLAQLHCEPLPPTPVAIRDFAAKWGKVSTGMTGEGGRRIDAIVLGCGWEVGLDESIASYDIQVDDKSASDSQATTATASATAKAEGRRWNTHEYHYHFVTTLLPNLLRQPPERNIRIISLIGPTYASALPTLLGKPSKGDTMQLSGAQGLTTLFFMAHLQRILNTLSAAALNLVKEVPNPDGTVKKRVDGDVQSNIMAITVVMPWARDEVMRGLFGVGQSWLRWLLWVVFFPIVFVLYPAPSQCIQSILFALQAPVRYGPLVPDSPQRTASEDAKEKTAQGEDGVEKEGDEGTRSTSKEEKLEPRRSAVGAGDVVRDSAVSIMPPVLSEPSLAKVTYDSLTKAVEEGVEEDAKREKGRK